MTQHCSTWQPERSPSSSTDRSERLSSSWAQDSITCSLTGSWRTWPLRWQSWWCNGSTRRLSIFRVIICSQTSTHSPLMQRSRRRLCPAVRISICRLATATYSSSMDLQGSTSTCLIDSVCCWSQQITQMTGNCLSARCLTSYLSRSRWVRSTLSWWKTWRKSTRLG